MPSKTGIFCRSLVFAAAAAFTSTPTSAQIYLDPAPSNIDGNVVCTVGGGQLAVSDSTDECGGLFGEGAVIETLSIGNINGPPAQPVIVFDGTDGSASFNNGPVSFNSATVQFNGGTTTFDSDVTVNNNLATNGISNSGLVTTGSLSSNTIFGNDATITNVLSANGSFTDSLTIVGSASVNMGDNQVHGVAAGTANTDAVNVAQLVAATSGIATLQGDLTAETAERTAADVALDSRADALEATSATQTTQIAAIQAVNATQSTQISELDANVATLQTDVVGLQADVGTLFDLRSRDRREARRGTAAAVAMSEAPMPSRDGGISYSLHGAAYRGEYAVGGSLKYRVSPAFALDVGLSHAGHKDTAARVGISGEF